MIFRILDEAEFDNLREKFNYNFYQSSSWTRVKKPNGWSHEYVAVFKEDQPILLCMILMRKIFTKYICYAPRGPLVMEGVNQEEVYAFFLKHVKQHLKKKGGFVFKFDPYIEMRKHDRAGDVVGEWNNGAFVEFLKKQGCRHQGFTKGYSNDAQFRWSYGLSIKDKTEEDLKKDMNSRCKRCIKKAEKYPLTLVDVNEENIEDFKNVMVHTATRHVHSDRGAAYYLRLAAELKDQIRVSLIYLDREAFLEGVRSGKYEVKESVYQSILQEDKPQVPLSAGVFIMDKKQMNYVFGGTYSYYFPLMAQFKMQMEMIRFSMEKQLDVYDFGGIPGIFDKDAEGYKIYDYKRGYGGYVIEYIGEFDLPISRAYLSLYEKMVVLYKKSKTTLAKMRKGR